MAKKITIQHYYTTGSSAPDTTALTYGEIAMATKTGDEAIFFKNQSNEIVSFISSGKTLNLITEKTSGITSDENFIAHKNSLAKEFVLKPGTTQFNKDDAGHVLLVGGDLIYNTGETVVDGIAASPYHFHSQYLTGVTGDSGQTIVSLIENGVAKIGLTTGITNQINSGATAYGWGDHAIVGYAKNTDLTTHTNNGDIHVTKIQKDAWDKAKDDINAFMTAAESGTTALDTLKEIQDFLTSDDGTVQTLLDNLSALTDTVSGNTEDITNLTGEVNNKVDSISASGNLSATTINIVDGPKQYKIIHTSAGTQASAITATNTTTDLSFGSEFNIVDNIGYDANGHVVTGSTQTLKLPSLVTANTENYGIVKTLNGDLSNKVLDATPGLVAHVSHYHSQYATLTNLESYIKLTDLSNNTGNTITISCGTY